MSVWNDSRLSLYGQVNLKYFFCQVSTMELVQEIYQVLVDREDTCHRTCFSLQLDGNTLDNFAELKSIEGLTEGSVIKVVEGQFSFQTYICINDIDRYTRTSEMS